MLFTKPLFCLPEKGNRTGDMSVGISPVPLYNCMKTVNNGTPRTRS